MGMLMHHTLERMKQQKQKETPTAPKAEAVKVEKPAVEPAKTGRKPGKRGIAK